jgi:polar amino acid transport system permease protein
MVQRRDRQIQADGAHSDVVAATPPHNAALLRLASQDIPKHRRRHPGQWISAIVLLFLAVFLIHSLAGNSKIGWGSVGHFLFAHAILSGLVVTLELTVFGQALAIVLGLVLAAMRQSRNRVLSWLSWVYIQVFRGVPLIVQILVWYNLALAFPHLAIGVPFASWHIQGNTNKIITPLLAGVLALGLAEAAYMAEIIRAGIVAVPRGQVDAALSVGLTRRQAMRRIVLPQTLRVVIPPTGNQFIGLLKASALVSVIGGDDLLTRSQQIYSVNFEVVALLIVASIWYLVLTTVFTVGQYYLEQWLDRERLGGDRQISTGSLRKRLGRNLTAAPGPRGAWVESEEEAAGLTAQVVADSEIGGTAP